MEITKYIDRKYPLTKYRIKKIFNKEQLCELRKKKMKIGILNSDIINCVKYKKGRMFMYKRMKEYDCSDDVSISNSKWTGGFEIYCVFKCQKGYTKSGYHGFTENNNLKFTEVVM